MPTTSAKRAKVIARRRRALMAAIGVVVVAFLVLVVWRPWEHVSQLVDAVAPTQSAESSTEAETPETAPYTPIGGQPANDDGVCTANEVVITAITDAVNYQAGQSVQIAFSIENVSDAVCSMNVGTTQQSYVVTTGQQTVFRSTDCPIETVDQIVELQPGVVQTTVPIVWDRTFSSPETCASPRESVVAGGASYHVQVSVAGIAAQSTIQILLY